MIVNAYALSASASSQYAFDSYKSGMYRQTASDGSDFFASHESRQSLYTTTTVSQQFIGYGTREVLMNDAPAAGLKEDEETKKMEKKRDEAVFSDAARKRSDEARMTGNIIQFHKMPGLMDSKVDSQLDMKAKILETLLFYLDGNKRTVSGYPFKERLSERLNDLKAQMGAQDSSMGAQGSSGGGEVQSGRNSRRDSSIEPRDASQSPGKEAGFDFGPMMANLRYGEVSHTSESQSITYAAQGFVKTADGQQIAFDVSLNMSSSYSQTSVAFGIETNLKSNLVDPLVINYSGTAASLTQTKFEFDLDFDGNKDQISFAGPGSGFLALDKDGDGAITDGRELFGPQSGEGFSELAQYDTDGNMWIDEADEIYSKLRIWSKDENGNDQLFTLKEADVGAIFIGNTKTSMTMYDQTYNMQGRIQSTGIFLRDSGGAGTVQHIDLAV